MPPLKRQPLWIVSNEDDIPGQRRGNTRNTQTLPTPGNGSGKLRERRLPQDDAPLSYRTYLVVFIRPFKSDREQLFKPGTETEKSIVGIRGVLQKLQKL